MSALGWPFLIGRVRGAGHRVVVAPGFMITAGTEAELDAVSGRAGEGEVVTYALPGGQHLAVAVVVAARAADFGLEGEGPLRDRAGRTILLTEGLVIPSNAPHPCAQDLQRAHRDVVPAYREFWVLEEDYTTTASGPLKLIGQGRQAGKLVPTSRTGSKRPWRRRRWVDRLFLLATLGSVLLSGLTVTLNHLRLPDEVASAPPTNSVTSAPPACSTAVCLLSPDQLDEGVRTTLTPADGVDLRWDATCRGALVSWTGEEAPELRVGWDGSDRKHVDLSKFSRVRLDLDSTGEVAVVLTDDSGGTRAATPDREEPSAWTLPEVDLGAVRSIAVRPSSRTELCLRGLTFE